MYNRLQLFSGYEIFHTARIDVFIDICPGPTHLRYGTQKDAGQISHNYQHSW